LECSPRRLFAQQMNDIVARTVGAGLVLAPSRKEKALADARTERRGWRGWMGWLLAKASLDFEKSGTLDVEDSEGSIGNTAANTLQTLSVLDTQQMPSVLDQQGSVAIEDYYEVRVRPQLEALQSRASRFSWLNAFMDAVVIISASSGTLLAALSVPEWVPIAVALGGAASAMVAHSALRVRLASARSGVGRLTSACTAYDSLSVITRCQRIAKDALIESVEGALIEEAQAVAMAVESEDDPRTAVGRGLVKKMLDAPEVVASRRQSRT